MPEEVDDAAEAGPPLEAPVELSLDILRHSAAHLMAAAVCELFPGTQYDVGPAIEDGFFYNFLLPEDRHLTEADLAAIEERMGELAAAAHPLPARGAARATRPGASSTAWARASRSPSSTASPRTSRASPSTAPATSSTSAAVPTSPTAACSPPSSCSASPASTGAATSATPSSSGSTAPPGQTAEDLAAYLERLAEAERRDHRRLGRELELFHFDASAPGMPYWLPNGVIVLNELIDFWRRTTAPAATTR